MNQEIKRIINKFFKILESIDKSLKRANKLKALEFIREDKMDSLQKSLVAETIYEMEGGKFDFDD